MHHQLPNDSYVAAYLIAAINKKYWLKFMQDELKANAIFFADCGFHFNPTTSILLIQELTLVFGWFTAQSFGPSKKNKAIVETFLTVIIAQYNMEPMQQAIHQKIHNFTSDHNYPPIDQQKLHARFTLYNKINTNGTDHALLELLVSMLKNCLPFDQFSDVIQRSLITSLFQYSSALRTDLKPLVSEQNS